MVSLSVSFLRLILPDTRYMIYDKWISLFRIPDLDAFVSHNCLLGKSPSDSLLLHSLNFLAQGFIILKSRTIGVTIHSHVINKIGKNRMPSFLVRCLTY